MLSLIGLGLWNEKDITLNGLEEAKKCDLIFLEAYTSKLMGSSKEIIEKMIGKQIQLAPREFIESGEILGYAEKNNVALLVAGDPLVATTHSDLILRAKKKKIKMIIVHNASIYSAIAETGLQIYKFGRSATITFWEGDYKPISWFDVYRDNSARGLHTLFFLDLQMDKNKFMSAQEGIEQLIKAGLDKETKIIVCSQLGNPESKITYGTASELSGKDVGLPLQVIIIPGNLHDVEKEFIETFK